MINRLDKIPSPLNPKSKVNGITWPVLIVLMMILRQAARDGIIPAAPGISIPKQESVRHAVDHDPEDDVASPEQVEALCQATSELYGIMVLLAAWCQLRRGECLGLQRRDIEWHDDGSATSHVRRQLNANSVYMSVPKSDVGKRELSIPRITLDGSQSTCATTRARGTKWSYPYAPLCADVMQNESRE